jgi:tripartite-type tricarboxylate transporter receptor subunit TctC
MASIAIAKLARITATAAALVALPISAGSAQSPTEFFNGKTIDLEIGYSAGGGYDLYARLIARHLGKHIPGNPTLAPKNMAGAGSLLLANWLYGAAPRDASAIGALSRGAAFGPLLGEISAQFDASKFSWIGSANDEVSVCVALPASGISKFDDLLTKPLTVGSTGVGDDTYQFPRVLNEVLGTKFKIIPGHQGSNELTQLLERGDIQGRCGWSWSSIKATRPDWIASKKIIVLVQMSLSKHPDLPDVPLIMDLAKTAEQRQIFKLIFARQVMGRPYAAPPGVPGDRVAALRQAFSETMKDKDFLDEAERGKFEIYPVSGERLEALVEEVYQTPPGLAQKAAALLR